MIGCYLNLDDKVMEYSLNGQALGKAFDIPKNLEKSNFYPAVVLKVNTLIDITGSRE